MSILEFIKKLEIPYGADSLGDGDSILYPYEEVAEFIERIAWRCDEELTDEKLEDWLSEIEELCKDNYIMSPSKFEDFAMLNFIKYTRKNNKIIRKKPL